MSIRFRVCRFPGYRTAFNGQFKYKQTKSPNILYLQLLANTLCHDLFIIIITKAGILIRLHICFRYSKRLGDTDCFNEIFIMHICAFFDDQYGIFLVIRAFFFFLEFFNKAYVNLWLYEVRVFFKVLFENEWLRSS